MSWKFILFSYKVIRIKLILYYQTLYTTEVANNTESKEQSIVFFLFELLSFSFAIQEGTVQNNILNKHELLPCLVKDTQYPLNREILISVRSVAKPFTTRKCGSRGGLSGLGKAWRELERLLWQNKAPQTRGAKSTFQLALASFRVENFRNLTKNFKPASDGLLLTLTLYKWEYPECQHEFKETSFETAEKMQWYCMLTRLNEPAQPHNISSESVVKQRLDFTLAGATGERLNNNVDAKCVASPLRDFLIV